MGSVIRIGAVHEEAGAVFDLFDYWFDFIDGRGGDGCTVSFVANGNDISYLRKWPFSLGMAYRALGQIIGGIHAHDLETSGKTMGLTAYGRVISGWKRAIHTFITSYRPKRDQLASWEPAVADGCFLLFRATITLMHKRRNRNEIA